MYGPRALEPGRADDISARTLLAYQRASRDFIEYCDTEHYAPHCAEEWDDLIVEWSVAKNARGSQMRELMAAIEFLFPRYKGKLHWSKARLSTLSRITPPKHAAPAGREISALYAAHMASMGRARLGLAMMTQAALGLRPGEVLKLRPDDIRRSPEASKKSLVVFRLGRRVGTKVGREQFAILDVEKHASLWSAIALAISLTHLNQLIFPYAMSTYYGWLKRTEEALALDLDISPHSPRAGFASDLIAEGVPPNTVKEAGRWISDTSFRIYIDVVGALFAAQAVRLAGYGPAISWVLRHPEDYFTPESLDVYAVQHGASGGAASGTADCDANQEVDLGWTPDVWCASAGGGGVSCGRGRACGGGGTGGGSRAAGRGAAAGRAGKASGGSSGADGTGRGSSGRA